MKLTIVITAMVGSAFLITLGHAADTEQQKPKPQMEQKQPKDIQRNDRVAPGGSVGEERTGGPGTSGTGGNVTVPPHQGAKKKP